jgi:serine/threonine protein phosphatase PrpC
LAAESEMLVMRSYGATDVGRRREANEDAFLRDDQLGLWVVADGMGGHAAGEVASREAIDTINGMVRRGKDMLGPAFPFTDEKGRAASRMLEGGVQAATYLLYAMAELDRGMAGMGTTISAMMRFGNHLVVGQVGDSRIYRVRAQEAEQLTEDHTLIAWQLKQGLITAEQARVSRQRPGRYECLGRKRRGSVPRLQRRPPRLPKARGDPAYPRGRWGFGGQPPDRPGERPWGQGQHHRDRRRSLLKVSPILGPQGPGWLPNGEGQRPGLETNE